ncbi:hypothetical protein SAMN02745131_01022 [Flavisolibacter ginsengisoli DSM 18119]|jgi:hypothetical protein|uniref:Uncharacterized protein n=1 Tax=Flavisolibacter ginsengisoli DSM 18119 TaxID=1121884 RepID=A0A1M4VYJ5_9BACT|nr:hypothetical protein SAMN02745131_01022 [Flavisolibacter ginsengisoli DSM 18119]
MVRINYCSDYNSGIEILKSYFCHKHINVYEWVGFWGPEKL